MKEPAYSCTLGGTGSAVVLCKNERMSGISGTAPAYTRHSAVSRVDAREQAKEAVCKCLAQSAVRRALDAGLFHTHFHVFLEVEYDDGTKESTDRQVRLKFQFQ